jgi:hypothetical protein
VSYNEVRCNDERTCIRVIRDLLDRGWQLTQIRGGSHGPYSVVVRKDEAERGEPKRA